MQTHTTISTGYNSTLLTTDQSASVISRFGSQDYSFSTYTPYGHANPSKDDTLVLGFNDQWLLTQIEGYLLGNGRRLFRPDLMRFCSPDSLSPFGEGGINAYAYCGGDPVNRHDPTGQMFKLVNRMFKLVNRMFKPVNKPKTMDVPTDLRTSFEKVMDIPHLSDQILGHLSSKDMGNFSHVSRQTYGVTTAYSQHNLNKYRNVPDVDYTHLESNAMLTDRMNKWGKEVSLYYRRLLPIDKKLLSFSQLFNHEDMTAHDVTLAKLALAERKKIAISRLPQASRSIPKAIKRLRSLSYF